MNAVETKKKPSRRVHSGVPALGSQHKLQGICKVWSSEIAEHTAEAGR